MKTTDALSLYASQLDGLGGESDQPVLTAVTVKPSEIVKFGAGPDWHMGLERHAGVVHFSHPSWSEGTRGLAWATIDEADGDVNSEGDPKPSSSPLLLSSNSSPAAGESNNITPTADVIDGAPGSAAMDAPHEETAGESTGQYNDPEHKA